MPVKLATNATDKHRSLWASSFSWVVAVLSALSDVDVDVEQRRRPKWRKLAVKAINLVYFYCIIKVLLSLWFLYEFDGHLYKYKLLLRQHAADDEQLEAAAGRVLAARSRAKQVGAAFIQLPYFIEYACCVTLVVGVGSKTFMSWYFRHVRRPRSDLVERLVEEERGRQWSRRMLKLEMDRYLASNNHFSEIHRCSRGSKGASELAASLKQLALAGELEPFNRRDSELARYYQVYLGILALITLYWIGLVWMGLSGRVLDMMPGERRVETRNFMDQLQLVEWWLFATIANVSATFHFTNYMLVAYDQIRTVKELTRRVHGCQPNGGQMADSEGRLLLITYFQYKLFTRQTRQVQPQQATSAVSGAMGVWLVLLLLHLHSAYLEDSLVTPAFLVCVSGFNLLTIIWLPICHFHCGCRHLYRALHSLVARSSQAPSRTCDERHTIRLWLLELRHPRAMLAQFAAQKFGQSITYETYLRHAFWFCLLLAISRYMRQVNRVLSIWSLLL